MVTDVTTLPSDSPLVYAMASCHSLIKLNGELTGNPLDVKVFESIEWELKVNNGLIRIKLRIYKSCFRQFLHQYFSFEQETKLVIDPKFSVEKITTILRNNICENKIRSLI